ncbi:hypothetical protein BC936DRAFT_144103, partial [Jimgerdemannia flammicorona]
TYDVLRLVSDAVRYFNKDILRNAVTRAFKTPKSGKVEGASLQAVPRESVYVQAVPRESVYNAELYRIFIRWLVDSYDMEVTGQWHVVTESDPTDVTSKLGHEYFDIVISTNREIQSMIILELVASGVKTELEKHFEKALIYGSRFDNVEIWVIHFTCLDDAIAKPIWQSNEELRKGLNVAHFWHDLSFKQMTICARWLEEGR